MSLNCLTCQQMQRSDSERQCSHEKPCRKLCCVKIDRSWSGNISPPPYEQINISKSGPVAIGVIKKKKKEHRRLNSAGSIAFKGNHGEPRLVRSSGMRRDWSFENLRQRMAT